MYIGQKAILENEQPADWLSKGTIVQITEIFEDYVIFIILESLDKVSIGVVLGNPMGTNLEGFNSRFKLI